MKRNCNNCKKEYEADVRNVNRGWGLCCSKSCAAKKREESKPGYNIDTVLRNNRIREGKMTDKDFTALPISRQIYLNRKRFGKSAPNIVNGSGRISAITSEGYRVMDGVAYDEWDSPIYNIDKYEDYHFSNEE